VLAIAVIGGLSLLAFGGPGGRGVLPSLATFVLAPPTHEMPWR